VSREELENERDEQRAEEACKLFPPVRLEIVSNVAEEARAFASTCPIPANPDVIVLCNGRRVPDLTPRAAAAPPDLEAVRAAILQELRGLWLLAAPDRSVAMLQWPELEIGLCRWLAGGDFPHVISHASTEGRHWLSAEAARIFLNRMAAARAAAEALKLAP
jgi:hypothetical protein